MAEKLSKFEALAEENQLGNHPELVEDVVEYLNLSMYWALYDRLSEERHLNDAVFHNDLHTRLTVMNTYQTAMYAGLDKTLIPLVVAAAIFADFDHTKTAGNEDSNLYRAINGFNKCQSTLNKAPKYKSLTEKDGAVVRTYMRSTKTPYTALKPTQMAQRVLRDAIAASWYYGDDQVRVTRMLGLFTEHYPHHRSMSHAQQRLAFIDFSKNHLAEVMKMQWMTRYGYTQAQTLNWVGLHKRALKTLEATLTDHSDEICLDIGSIICGHSVRQPSKLLEALIIAA